VKYYADADPHKRPHMLLSRINLDAELFKGLKSALQKSYGVLDADSNFRDVVVEGSLIRRKFSSDRPLEW